MPITNPMSAIPIGTAGSATTSTDTTSTRSSQLDKDTFLKLLVAQLKYQDPSSPADSTQFMAQSAQFTMVESLQDIKKQMDVDLTLQLMSASANYLGRDRHGYRCQRRRGQGCRRRRPFRHERSGAAHRQEGGRVRRASGHLNRRSGN